MMYTYIQIQDWAKAAPEVETMEMDTEKAGNGYGANLNVDTSTIQQSGVEETSSMMQAGVSTFFFQFNKKNFIFQTLLQKY